MQTMRPVIDEEESSLKTSDGISSDQEPLQTKKELTDHKPLQTQKELKR